MNWIHLFDLISHLKKNKHKPKGLTRNLSKDNKKWQTISVKDYFEEGRNCSNERTDTPSMHYRTDYSQPKEVAHYNLLHFLYRTERSTNFVLFNIFEELADQNAGQALNFLMYSKLE